MEKQKINIYDILYIILMFMLMDNRLSLAPQSLPFKMFIYQIASCVIILFSLIIFKKIYIPLQIMLVYFLVLIQSGLVILTGKTYTNTIIREDIQLILLLIFVIVIYNYFLRSPVKFLKIFKYAFYFWCISALMFEAAYFVFGTSFGILEDSYFPYPRATGFNVDPNVFGIYILTFMPLALFCSRSRIRNKIFILLLSITCIIFSFSRSNIVLTGVFILIYFLYGLYLKKIGRREVFCTILILAAMALCMFSIPTLRNAAILRVSQFGIDANANSNSRFGLWVKALGVIKKYPILGVGFDHPILYIGRYIHNTFIEWVASCGVFGVIVIIFYISNLIKHLLKAGKSDFDFYMSVAYITHFITISFVSELNFEPTFLLLALSQVNMKNNININEEYLLWNHWFRSSYLHTMQKDS